GGAGPRARRVGRFAAAYSLLGYNWPDVRLAFLGIRAIPHLVVEAEYWGTWSMVRLASRGIALQEGFGVSTKAADLLLADEAPIVEIDELRGLIAEGQEKGFLTFEQ